MTYAVLLSPHNAIQLDSRNVGTHEFEYTVTNLSNYYQDINVGFTCEALVATCLGKASNASRQQTGLGAGTSGTGRVVYTLATTGTAGNLYLGAWLDAQPAIRDSGVVRITTSTNLALVGVSPTSLRVTAPKGRSATQAFVIANKGTATDTLDFSVACSPTLLCQGVSGTTLPLQPDDSTTVTVPYTIPAVAGDSVRITMTALSHDDRAMSRSGTVTVIATNDPPLKVVTSSVNSGAQVDRSGCVAVGVGPSAAYECSDLRLSHALPAVTTMGKTRSPGLTYLSRHASPVAFITADVTALPGAYPAGIIATVIAKNLGDTMVVHTAVQQRFIWNADWSDVKPRRIVVPVTADAANLTTGAYLYSLEVKPADSTSSLTAVSDAGTFTLIDRRQSQFGAGWWLDGVEEVKVVDSNRRLWIGGDGAARLYVRSSGSTFLASPVLDRPDTLTDRGSGLGYRRAMRNGAYVDFDAAGRHSTTRDVLGNVTAFTYTGVLLTKITVPVPSGGPERAYTFDYAADATGRQRLSVVHSPSGAGGDRPTTVSNSSGSITGIRFLPSNDPQSRLVSFGYSPTVPGQVTSRTDRRGYTTSFSYDAGGLALARVVMAGTGDDIVNTFCAAETRSLTSCSSQPELLANAYTKWDGPRTGVLDTTIFYLNRFGAPDTVVNAVAQRTRVWRNTTFPLLVDSTIAPNGLKSTATYNARGLPDVVRVVDPVNNGQDAITRYRYHAKWDLADTVTAPMGETTVTGYDPTNSWPYAVWQQDGRGALSRATFTYNAARQLELVTPPGNPANSGTRLDYDALGNVRQATSAIGFVVTHDRDGIGQDTLTVLPTDSAQTTALKTKTRTTYDATGAVIRSWTIGAPTTFSLTLAGGSSIAVPGDSTEIYNQYDPEGRVVLTVRTAYPDRAGIGDVLTHTTYDAAGRVTTTRSLSGGVHAFTYDPAGNMLTETMPGDDVIRMEYDGVNRLTKRVQLERSAASTQACSVTWQSPWFTSLETAFFCNQAAYRFPLWGDFVVPRDSATYVYDPAGRIIEARNGSAIVRRSYAKAGAILTDTLYVRTYGPTGGDEYARHVYPLSYTYDAGGRRTSMSYPGSLLNNSASCAYGGTCTQRYTYNVVSGMLDSTTDVLGNGYAFAYDSAGRVRSRTAPGSVSETFDYDLDGRLRGRVEGGFVPGLHNDRYRRDAQGRVVELTTTFPDYTNLIVNTYNTLGALVGVQNSRANGWANVELFDVDAFGHHVRSESISNTGDHRVDRYAYQSGTERATTLTGDTATAPGRTPTLNFHKTTYTPSGGVEWAVTQQWNYAGPGGGISGPDVVSASRSFYQADGKLRAFSRAGTLGKRSTRNLYEEYRYDAFGRRILERAQPDSTCTVGYAPTYDGSCRAAITRTVWDGDQILLEERSVVGHTATWQQLELGLTIPGGTVTYGGTVAYTHAGGIDAPLSLIRNGTLIMPHANWRGEYDAGTTASGARQQGDVDWPGNDMRSYFVWEGWEGNVGWSGSLLNKKRDESGLLYMRNRYFDPGTGRFTQPDPIGLAGGTSEYGFANGDPVNFSDPFGLSPEADGTSSSLDCRKVKCPEPKVIILDKNVRDAAGDLEKATRKDGKERGAFLFNGPNGSIRVGPYMTGTKTRVPQMGRAPDDAIGSIHSHGDGSSPSGYDVTHARVNHINVEVVSGGKLYILDQYGNAKYVTPRVP